MTTPRYREGCSAGSQERGDASPDVSDPEYAWNVNFNYGNANLNHRNNHGFVRAVRSVSPASPREYQGARARSDVSLRALYDAWQCARRKKKPSANQLEFETHWIDRLIHLQNKLLRGTWTPSPSLCFIADQPKAREIHAPSFVDRIVHHWLVPLLEAIYERTFIADSFSNRVGKGTHAAVDRVRTFARAVHSGEGGGWYLQLDISNFFVSIHRPTLYAMLKRRMRKRGIPLVVQRVVHALLRWPIQRQGIRHHSTPAERARVPAHKRLENARSGCGIPIGNLSSQFFANVYLDALDQFVKHVLGVKRYVRYVDDFILFHHDRAQLERWQAAIAEFLQRDLRLALKPEIRLRRIESGIDFLGYVVHPTHTRVRRRVVAHARSTLAQWEQRHVDGKTLRDTPPNQRDVTARWRSYQGHQTHANTHRLQRQLLQRFPWLPAATKPRRFHHRAEHRPVAIAW